MLCAFIAFRTFPTHDTYWLWFLAEAMHDASPDDRNGCAPFFAGTDVVTPEIVRFAHLLGSFG